MSEISGGGFKPLPSQMMRKPEAKPADVKLREVSDMYEKHFLREMLKSMRSTVQESGFIKSNQAEKIFKEQLDDQYVEKWGERGGIGLSNLIYDQLINKFGEAMGIRPKVLKPMGPLKMDEKSNYHAKPFVHPGKKEAVSYRIEIPEAGTPRESVAATENSVRGSKDVKAPWDGVLLGSKKLADEQTLVEIEHDNGLKSQMVFSGGLSKNLTGQKVQAGETLGFLSQDAQSLYWTIEPVEKTVSE